ncbi:MAG: DinB family protein [Longimicrobiales bacterium]
MRARVAVVALAIGLATPLSAQMTAVAAPEAAPSEAALKLTESVQPLYGIIKGWVLSSAEQVSESDYAFRPTPEVRSFGELIGHVANAHYLFCSIAQDEENPSQEDFEERTGKAELIEALQASIEYCDAVFAGMGDDAALETVEIFGNEMSRLGVLAFNISHDFEHYGNIVTYMRLRGMVPPSSQ